VTSLLAAMIVGYLAARLTWLAARPVFALPALVRQNYRGRALPTAAGIVLPLAAVLVEGGRAVVASFGVGDGPGTGGIRALVLLAALGFGILGFIDDLAGGGGGVAAVDGGSERGFRGHLGALVAGRVTTGALKLVGGGVLALLVVAPVVGESPGRLLADGALVALCANLGNLLDRAPGRTIKAGVMAFAVLALAARRTDALSGVAVVVGAALGLLLDDLHERLMLGDAGSNVLGAALGLGLVAACGSTARDVALVAVAALNVAGELVSFSRVIDTVPPLRALDRAGRLP
jgi:UDP-N-acetylmuramyl pentapeptide phosphotransferase/UDP-N-acetylglucosamine-1-phosphate transferase